MQLPLRPLLILLAVLNAFGAPPPNHLAISDQFSDIYYPNQRYPKLTTPQWIGEKGVDAVLVFAIDDMRDHQKYEEYLRPILERLKQIDGRAPVSIMTCRINPQEPHLQKWLGEGVSLEAHTIDHPCPILDKGDFDAAKSTYDRCVDMMFAIPGNRPVAFRTPCMDGINSASPRLFAEIMLGTTPSNRFLTMSSSVGLLLTDKDPENPRDRVLDANGKSRFAKYLLPDYINYIENYPYPYVIGNRFWELPFCVPDDYEGSRVYGDKGPQTVADMKAAIDTVVAKKGIWVMTFHPYQWITNRQVIELIDHTVSTHGSRAKILTFREVQERIDRNLLAGEALRRADGGDNGVRIVDLNSDGFLDVAIGNKNKKLTRIWNPSRQEWIEFPFPAEIGPNTRLAKLQKNGNASVFTIFNGQPALWHLNGQSWTREQKAAQGIEPDALAFQAELDQGLRFRDLDGDGLTEFIISNPRHNQIYAWNTAGGGWTKLTFALPEGASIVNAQGQDNGARFVDLNKDGHDDFVHSNEHQWGAWLFVRTNFLGFKPGYSRQIARGRRGEAPELPMIVRAGPHRDNGAWFAFDHLWVQNEDTGKLPGLVQRVSFAEILDGFQPRPRTPAQSLEDIQLPPGLQLELMAQEPVVQDPVYLDWSADGSPWVVEMRDYPTGIDGQPGGVIKRLQDADGDGFYESAAVFMDQLNAPTALLPWRKGLLVSAAPEIFYAEDTNRDGRADRKEVLFTGFRVWNTQHQVNGFELGLDGWIYGANGDSGGDVKSVKTGQVVPIRGHDFRFKPDTGEFESISGQTQHARRRDDWGNWFGTANYTWGWHFFLEEHYLKRNPHLLVRSAYRPYASGPDAGRVYPISRLQQRFNDVGMAGHVTSACGLSRYRGDLFSGDILDSIFICEPSHNLVHREVLRPEGVSFTSRRARGEEQSEFIASRDPWFRPVLTRTGPDGAIYVCDMYRLVIEHPEWIPEDVKNRMNIRAGEGLGRIYRIRPAGKELPKMPNLAALPSSSLAERMESGNGWQRDTVQRLLMERNESAARPVLARLAEGSPDPRVRLQALCTLTLLDKEALNSVVRALDDSHPAVREQAIRLSERWLTSEPPAVLVDQLLGRVQDSELRVRYQLAFSLGEWADPRAPQALAGIARQDFGDPAVRTAVLSSSAHRARPIILALLEKEHRGSQPLVTELLDQVARTESQAAARELVQRILDSQGGEITADKMRILAAILKQDRTSAAPREWRRFIEQARARALQPAASQEERLAAVQLLGLRPAEAEEDLKRLCRLVEPGQPAEVQLAALERLKQIDHPAVAGLLLNQWPSTTPELRTSIAALLLRREPAALALLAAVERGQVSRESLGATVRQELLEHPSGPVRERAGAVFQSSGLPREAIVQGFLGKVEPLQGSPERGRELFTTHCALCHKAGSLGSGAGPNLATLQDRTTEQILVAILDPNRAVEERYRSYVAQLKNGEEFTGLLVNETTGSVTMTGINGVEQTLRRGEIRQLQAQSRSVMPEGFDQFLSPRDLADLISFIRAAPAPQAAAAIPK